MAKPKNKSLSKRGGVIGRRKLYQYASKHAQDAIDVLVYHMHHGQASVRVGAAKTLLNKVIPDLKAQEHTGKDGQKLEGLVIVRTDGNTIK